MGAFKRRQGKNHVRIGLGGAGHGRGFRRRGFRGSFDLAELLKGPPALMRSIVAKIMGERPRQSRPQKKGM